MKKISLILVSLFLLCRAHADGLDKLPVQDGGRVKPYDTLARETLHMTWGKESFKGRAATEVVFSWMLAPEQWDQQQFLLIRHNGLREAMKLEHERLYYSPAEIMSNDRLNLLMQELKNKRDIKEKLNPFDQAVATLENQLIYYNAMKAGMLLHVLPQEGNSTWKGVNELDGVYREKFAAIHQAFMRVAAAEVQQTQNPGAETKAGVVKARQDLTSATDDFVKAVESKFGDYSTQKKINLEALYNKAQPFRWAWVAYLLSLVLFSFAYFGTKTHWVKLAWGATAVAMIFHLWGFGTRVYILGRPPVSNMFETVAWVALLAVIFSAIIYKFQKSLILPLGASMVAVLSLILCDVASSVLDESLTQLEPVLRDNFWLLTHVLIIVSSYAAFFLAFFMGDIMLFYFLKDEKKYRDKINQGAQSIYRAIQIGVVLLAAGIILGGVWADYSWGRFWGWDPKETWAFIALLGYVAILHCRLIGVLKQFGTAVASVVAFSLVIMAWYGVNFVLGAGLHSYGFGAGGVEYVTGFVVLHILFVAYVVTLRQSRLANSEKSVN